MLKIKKPVLIAFITSLVSILLTCCNQIRRNNSHPEIPGSSIKKGKALAASRCASCHSLPDPSFLTSKIWENQVLPAMAPRLGIFSWKGMTYPAMRNDMSLDKNFYASKPTVSEEEWQNIMDYYIATSPNSLFEKQVSQPAIASSLRLFSVKTPSYTYPNAATSALKVIEGPAEGLYVADAIKQKLYKYDFSLRVVDSVATRGPLVDLELVADSWIGCDIGVLNPNNGKYGAGIGIFRDSSGKLQKNRNPLFESLQRPVQISTADFNNDGKPDYLVCGFGYLTGALSWMENKGDGKFEKHILRPLPGALKAYIDDYNQDGLSDFWVLFAQGEEGVFLFTNKGHGQFEHRQVLRFPAVYGSSYFEFADFNKDGFKDILYTCGDNADYSAILKPYHGVYIFINDGHNNFTQKYFYHVNGCYKAMARDFDNDGDLDIASISFFADYKNRPEEGFVYLENNGNFSFKPFSIEATEQGRWLTMETGDVNMDGQIDIILGNFSIGPAMLKSKNDWKKAPQFILLQNTGRKSF